MWCDDAGRPPPTYYTTASKYPRRPPVGLHDALAPVAVRAVPGRTLDVIITARGPGLHSPAHLAARVRQGPVLLYWRIDEDDDPGVEDPQVRGWSLT